jgi:5'-nucleotidase
MPPSPPRAWQRMLSGRRLDLLDPSPLDIELSDIAHGLARVARWNGQTKGDYAFSVAQHSVLVMEIAVHADPGLDAAGRLYALLHDAPEYVMGDIISPFKAAMGGNYREVENRLLGAIHMRFSLAANPPLPIKKAVKLSDRQAAYFEAVELAGFERTEAAKIFTTPDVAGFDIDGFAQLMRPWPTQEAHWRYLGALEANLSDHG